MKQYIPSLAYSIFMRGGRLPATTREAIEYHVLEIQNSSPTVYYIQLHCGWQERWQQYSICLTVTGSHNSPFVVSREDTHLNSLVSEVFECFEKHQRQLGEIRISEGFTQVA